MSGGVTLNDIMNGISDLSVAVAELSSRLGTVESRLDHLESRLGTVESRLDSLESRLGAVESRLDHLESRLGTVESRLDSLGASFDSHFYRANYDMTKLGELIKVLDGRVSGLESDIKEIYDRLVIMEDRLSSHLPAFQGWAQLVSQKLRLPSPA